MMMIPIDQVLSQAGFIHLENHQQDHTQKNLKHSQITRIIWIEGNNA